MQVTWSCAHSLQLHDYRLSPFHPMRQQNTGQGNSSSFATPALSLRGHSANATSLSLSIFVLHADASQESVSDRFCYNPDTVL